MSTQKQISSFITISETAATVSESFGQGSIKNSPFSRRGAAPSHEFIQFYGEATNYITEAFNNRASSILPSSLRKKPIGEIIASIGEQIPEEKWANVPTDLAINLDHYLYGLPKQTDE